MADPYRYFRIEATELTEALQAGLLELERGSDTHAGLSAVLRHAHTLKGAARVVKHEASAALAHSLEDLLVPVREGHAQLSPELVSRALSLVDELKRHVQDLQLPVAAPERDAGEGAAVAQASEKTRESADTKAGYRMADREAVNRLLDNAATLGSHLAGLETSLTQVRRGRSRGAHPSTSLEQQLSAYVEVSRRELQELREGLERLRLVEVEGLKGALSRTLRDTALSANKRATFEFHGGGLQVEPELYAAAARGLLQAVKNAVFHGIEVAEVREKRGKPAEGKVKVTVTKRGSSVRFSCEDDGGGLDLPALRQVVRSRLGPGAAEPDDTAVIEALVRGGVSTTSAVTPVAGRGIGLDLVREAALSVGGTLSLEPRPGEGVVLSLEAKAALTAFPALLVLANEVSYAIPIEAIRQTTRAEVGRAHGSRVITLDDGGVAPFFPLSTLLEPEVRSHARRSNWTVVVLHGPSGAVALGVDRLLGTETVVAEAVPEGARGAPALAGVTRDVDGAPRFLLDPEALRTAAARAEPSFQETEHAIPVLVIDDSLTTRMLERSILESAGYEVDLATSGEEGLRLARARRYALFLVDVEMPGMDGFTFVETILSDPELRSIPAVLVTSRNSPDDLARGVRVGARAHIVKSEFDQVSLLELISKLVKAA